MTHSNKIYLSKSGKIFGPITFDQLQILKKQGEFERFIWVCYDLKRGWEPVTPPPPLPVESESVSSSQSLGVPPMKPTGIPQDIPQPMALPQQSVDRSLGESFLALCHNHRIVLSGRIKDINLEGCTLTHSQAEGSTLPSFHSGTKVILNLLDPKGSRSENVKAVAIHAMKNGVDWDYRLKWEHFPEILKTARS